MFAEVTGAPPQRLADAPVLAVQAPGRRLTGFPDAVDRLLEETGRLHQLILDRGERLALGRGHPGCIPAIHLRYMAENSLGVRCVSRPSRRHRRRAGPRAPRVRRPARTRRSPRRLARRPDRRSDRHYHSPPMFRQPKCPQATGNYPAATLRRPANGRRRQPGPRRRRPHRPETRH